MVERICATCQAANPIDDKFCGQCGAALERLLPAHRPPSALTIAGKQIPTHWQQIGKAAAVGAAALVAEAGLAWLQRRVEGGGKLPAFPTNQRSTDLARTAARVTTIISQRVIELIDTGDGKVRITDHHSWRRTDD
jgi:hypothetical protein